MKVALYGLGLWTLGMLPCELIDIQTTRIPTVVLVNLFLGVSLVWMVATGVVPGLMYPRRLVPTGGKGHEALPYSGEEIRIHLNPLGESAVASFLAIAFIRIVLLLIFELSDSAPMHFWENMVKGTITAMTNLGVAASNMLLCFLFSLSYAAVRRRSLWKKTANGLFFGFWLWFMIIFPLSILFLPIGTLTTFLWFTS